MDPEVEFEQAARAECHKVAEAIVEVIATSEVTPTKTGRLRNSFDVQETPEGVQVVTDAPYWRYVEYGVGDSPEQPFIRSAIEQVRAVKG